MTYTQGFLALLLFGLKAVLLTCSAPVIVDVTEKCDETFTFPEEGQAGVLQMRPTASLKGQCTVRLSTEFTKGLNIGLALKRIHTTECTSRVIVSGFDSVTQLNDTMFNSFPHFCGTPVDSSYPVEINVEYDYNAISVSVISGAERSSVSFEFYFVTFKQGSKPTFPVFTTTAKPTTAVPVATQERTTAVPEATEKRTTAAPAATQEPATAVTEATQKPTTAVAERTREPSTAAPVATQEPTTAVPEATQEPTTAVPEATQETTTAVAELTQKPSTAAPVATQEPTTAVPVATQEPSTAVPEATQELSTAVSETTAHPEESTSTKKPTPINLFTRGMAFSSTRKITTPMVHVPLPAKRRQCSCWIRFRLYGEDEYTLYDLTDINYSRLKDSYIDNANCINTYKCSSMCREYYGKHFGGLNAPRFDHGTWSSAETAGDWICGKINKPVTTGVSVNMYVSQSGCPDNHLSYAMLLDHDLCCDGRIHSYKKEYCWNIKKKSSDVFG